MYTVKCVLYAECYVLCTVCQVLCFAVRCMPLWRAVACGHAEEVTCVLLCCILYFTCCMLCFACCILCFLVPYTVFYRLDTVIHVLYTVFFRLYAVFSVVMLCFVCRMLRTLTLAVGAQTGVSARQQRPGERLRCAHAAEGAVVGHRRRVAVLLCGALARHVQPLPGKTRDYNELY